MLLFFQEPRRCTGRASHIFKGGRLWRREMTSHAANMGKLLVSSFYLMCLTSGGESCSYITNIWASTIFWGWILRLNDPCPRPTSSPKDGKWDCLLQRLRLPPARVLARGGCWWLRKRPLFLGFCKINRPWKLPRLLGELTWKSRSLLFGTNWIKSASRAERTQFKPQSPWNKIRTVPC